MSSTKDKHRVRIDVASDESSDDDDDDQDWGDWIDDDVPGVHQGSDQGEANASGSRGLHLAATTKGSGLETQFNSRVAFHALFPSDLASGAHLLKPFPSAKEALNDAKEKGCDLPALIKRNHLDALQVIRLLNYLRRCAINGKKIDAEQINQINGSEPFLNDDEELKPVKGYENDGLLQIDFDDLDEELGGDDGVVKASSEQQRIAELESQLYATQLAMQDVKQRLMQQMGLEDVSESSSDEEMDNEGKGRAGQASRAKKSDMSKDDAHYFSSYASHDIHQTMISDKVRTLSYAKFLLAPENAHLIRGKTVMDVGCGSGILSMFAARAGAKEVIAIDASAVAGRAKENVRVNRLDGIIQVHHAKVEELDHVLAEYVGKVDVIVSEWMGYFLLYESMLPAVLYARDRYLSKDGLMAPSHTRMLLSAVSDCDIINERMGFWDDVYGFTMKAMRAGLADEAWTDMLKPEQVATSVETLLELPLHTISPKQPSFTAPFALRIQRNCTIQAFVSWFDTWFTPDGNPRPRRDDSKSEEASSSEDEDDLQVAPGETLEGLPPCSTICPDEGEVRGLRLNRDAIVPKSSDVSGSGLTVSFTTSPFGPETHWKQTLFVLKEPIGVEKESVIVGVLHSTPNEDNSRELDVEIHYSIRPGTMPAATRRKSVETRTVQLFAVR